MSGVRRITIAAVLHRTAWIASIAAGVAIAQPSVDTTASRRTLEEASRDSCNGVSMVVQRCAPQPDDANRKPANDPLSRSRAATKAAFDQRDARARSAALEGDKASADSPPGDVQRLGTVTVTGTAALPPPTIEEVLQRALNPAVVSPDGTVSHYGADGVRYDCIAKCVGPACCATTRTLPNPARESNSIGR